MSSFRKHCWHCKDSGAQDSKDFPVAAVLAVLESNPRREIDAAGEAEGLMDAEMRRGLEQATEPVEIDVVSQDDAAGQRLIADAGGVAAVEGPAQKGGGDAGRQYLDKVSFKGRKDANWGRGQAKRDQGDGKSSGLQGINGKGKNEAVNEAGGCGDEGRMRRGSFFATARYASDRELAQYKTVLSQGGSPGQKRQEWTDRSKSRQEWTDKTDRTDARQDWIAVDRTGCDKEQ
ncbi:hypothetical protein AOQ84DRAFT_364398 [Glonium stellatum]|uniref:Uncharacterized protein n=1 Tax=Glonium stellatum TaxID=574774 RepID=A0A8E2F0Y0_9PEZI|nr:hypothetical protein AOQ84DRAFT_364398 [Glonium stellatum]